VSDAVVGAVFLFGLMQPRATVFWVPAPFHSGRARRGPVPSPSPRPRGQLGPSDRQLRELVDSPPKLPPDTPVAATQLSEGPRPPAHRARALFCAALEGRPAAATLLDVLGVLQVASADLDLELDLLPAAAAAQNYVARPRLHNLVKQSLAAATRSASLQPGHTRLEAPGGGASPAAGAY
jgi:hypothetical protein